MNAATCTSSYERISARLLSLNVGESAEFTTRVLTSLSPSEDEKAQAIFILASGSKDGLSVAHYLAGHSYAAVKAGDSETPNEYEQDEKDSLINIGENIQHSLRSLSRNYEGFSDRRFYVVQKIERRFQTSITDPMRGVLSLVSVTVHRVS